MAAVLNSLRRRWRLILAAVVILVLALVAGLAVAQRDNLFMAFNDPGKPFQIWQPPPAPDYADPAAWALSAELPEEDEDGAAVAPVFFIHPTTYSGGGAWNAPIDKELSARRLERIMLPNHAAPFAAAGPVFAPRYRQASLYSFLTNRDDARRARRFAYADVADAFDAFLERIGPDRGFVIAGVGQGGLHAIGLLRDRIAPDEAMRLRMLAAYVIDYPLPEDLFESYLAEIPPCAAPDQVRCVVAWSAAEAEDSRRIAHLTEQLMIWTSARGMDPLTGRRLLCVNPLLWNRSEDFAPARLNRGAVAAEGLEPDVRPSPSPGQTSAQCQDGILLTEKAESSRFRRPFALAERYRVPPYNIFYEDIRENAALRVEAGLARLADEARYAMPAAEIETVIIGDAPVHRVPD